MSKIYRVATGQGKVREVQDQGKVREFSKKSGKLKNHKKSGNFIITARPRAIFMSHPPVREF